MISITMYIPVKSIHNHDIVSVHFNHLYCDKLSRDLLLAMLTYIYHKVDD